LIPDSDCFERLSRTGDFREDLFGGFGPDEGFGVGIVVFEVLVNGSFDGACSRASWCRLGFFFGSPGWVRSSAWT